MAQNKTNELSALEQLEQDKIDEQADNHVANLNTIDFPVVNGQWYDIKREQLAYEGKYYKKSYRFQVQAASVSTIKYFSAMDENNPMSVKDALFKLISTHMRVLDGNRIINSLDVLQEVDQLRALLLINMYTGTGNSLKATVRCSGDGNNNPCNHTQEVAIDLNNLQYGGISDKIAKYFNPDTGEFNITTKSGLNLTYIPTTLRQQEKILDYTIELSQNGDEIEKHFTTLSGFYMHRFNDVDKAYSAYLKETSDVKTLGIMLTIVTKDLQFNQLLELKTTCKKCGRLHNEQITSIETPKNIFFVSSVDDEY